MPLTQFETLNEMLAQPALNLQTQECNNSLGYIFWCQCLAIVGQLFLIANR